MSLTSLIDDRNSALRQFLAEELPGVGNVRAQFKAAVTSAMPGSGTAAAVALPDPPAGVRPAWSTLGAAAEHRLRYSLAKLSGPGASVGLGVIDIASPRLGLPGPTAAALTTAGRAMLLELRELAETHQPWDRARPMLLAADVEEAFARACYVGAWYEEVFRAARLFPSTPLGAAGPDTTLPDLLAAVPGYAVEDLLALQARAAGALADLREATAVDDVHAAPVFAGSGDVGGADADLIAAGLLLDVKTTTNPAKVPTQANIWQLAGYVLLDYPDEHHITSVGWYLTRSGSLITWPLQDFLAMLGATRPLPELRYRAAALEHDS